MADNKKTGRKMPYEKRKAMYGYGFISLWMIGTLFFFLIPMIKSLWYSFNEVSIGTGKMVTEWVGLATLKICSSKHSGKLRW